MAAPIPRRKLANYIADAIESRGDVRAVLQQVAAYLVSSRRTREAVLVARRTEDELQQRGIVVARVWSAHKLTDELRKNLRSSIDGKQVELVEAVDPSLIAGIKLQLPDSSMDATVKRNITALSGLKR